MQCVGEVKRKSEPTTAPPEGAALWLLLLALSLPLSANGGGFRVGWISHWCGLVRAYEGTRDE